MTFMFRGKYAENMIGHEIINIFKADNDDKHYIYVNPYGRIGKEHKDKIGTILLARHVNNSRIEIITKAWGLKAFNGITESRPKDKSKVGIKAKREDHKKECENIKYGGQSIEKIFEEDDDPRELLISYEVEHYRRAKKEQPIRISYKEESDSSIKKMKGAMPRQTLLTYYLPSDKKEENDDYCTLKNIIENESNWETKDTSEKVNPDLEYDLNFLKIIGKEDNELVFSNWLAYYLKDHDILDRFARDVLELPEGVGKSFKLYREEEHIDLLIEDIDHRRYIVIENKIKSDIIIRQREDGEQREIRTQLDDYGDRVNARSKNKEANKEWNPENNKFFIFTPNYSNAFSKVKSKYDYKEIKYEKIYDFFKKIVDENKNKYPFISDFIIALSRHKGKYPDQIFEDMRRKFIDKINEIKQNK